MCRARRGGPRTPSTTTDANLDYAFVENALFLHQSLIVKIQPNRIELVTRPGQGANTAAGQGPIQLLTMVLRHLDEDKTNSGVGWTLLKNSLTPLPESSNRDKADWVNLLFSMPRVWSWNRFFQVLTPAQILCTFLYLFPVIG